MDICESCGQSFLGHKGCLLLCQKIEEIKYWITNRINIENKKIHNMMKLKEFNVTLVGRAEACVFVLEELKK